MFISYLKKKLSSQRKVESPFQKTSFSQCGEDLIIDYIFYLRNIPYPSYIDIGAHHPFKINNTALFYKKGSRGINIEANPELIKLFEKERPQDINLNIGVSSTDGELDFFIMKDDSLSSFSKAEFETVVASGKELKEVRKIRLQTIDHILKLHYKDQCPDFLSIDVEGMDFEILRSISFEKHSPKIICIEAAEYSPIGTGARRNELIDFLVSKDYYEYANTNLNAIMVKKEFWFV